MPNTHFQFKQFRIDQAKSGMKVTTDGCLFGAWVSDQMKNSQVRQVLDIGTGTGLLTLMLAQNTTALFTAVEYHSLAFEEAILNISQSPWNERITVHHCPIQDFQSDTAFDLIICNPPFFHQNKKGEQGHRNTAIHSDSLSIPDLVLSISRLLEETGVAYVMYPPHEMHLFEAEAQKMGIYPSAALHVRDNPEGAELRKMVGFSREMKPVAEEHLCIKNASGAYSSEFVHLLKDYYLHLD